MISLSYTQDYEAVLKLAKTQGVWEFVSDDLGAGISEYQLPISSGIHYYLIKNDNDVVGFAALISVTSLALELHMGLVPEFRGKKGGLVLQAIKEAMRRDMPQMRRLRIPIPEFNKAAVSSAIAAGLDLMGAEPNGCLKNGEFHNLLLFGAAI